MSERLICLLIMMNVLNCFAERVPKNIECDNSYECCEVESNACGIKLWAEALIWKTVITGMPYAASIIVQDNNFPTDEKVEHIGFSYAPGFRVGVGYTFPCREWNMDLIWTRFEQTGRDEISAGTRILETVWDIIGVRSNTATAQLREKFQTVDLIAERTLVSCPSFTGRYFFGLKGALVKEKMDIAYVGTIGGDLPATVNSLLLNDFHGFGFTNGFAGIWNITEKFGLYGRGEFALLKGRFKIKEEEQFRAPAATPPSVDLSNINTISAIKFNLVTEIGLRWSTPIWCDGVCLDLNFGYEYNLWPNQIHLTKFIAAETMIFLLQQPGDVGFQGFNIGAGLSF